MKLKLFGLATGLAALLLSAPNLSASGIPAGIGGSPPADFTAVDDMIMVGTHEQPIQFYIDPTGPMWQKQFTIPYPTNGLIPGVTRIPVWEMLQILPPQPALDGTTMRLPWTDWHEVIHNPPPPGDPTGGDPPSDGSLGGWEWAPQDAAGNLPTLTIHNAPGGPLVAYGGVGNSSGDPTGGNNEIWFAWPDTWIFPLTDGPLDVWIHKELVWRGPPYDFDPNAPPITVHVWEWPTTPEPSSILLAGLGLVGIVGLVRRRRSA